MEIAALKTRVTQWGLIGRPTAELNEAIPPDYSEFKGRSEILPPLLKHIRASHSQLRNPGAKERIRQFFLENIGNVVNSIQIRDAAGFG